MKKWEYNTILLNDNVDIAILDTYGKDGWELVTIVDNSKYNIFTAIFKREK